MTHYKLSEMKEIKIDNNITRLVCPECKEHKQITTKEFNKLKYEEQRQLDCKNTFGIGQCNCYSLEHKK